MSELQEHARRELDLAGLFDEDSDYDGMLGNAVMELIEVFSKQGHSGFSAELTLDVFNKVVHYENLTELTNNPDEWIDRSEMSGSPMWQSKRNPSVFSYDEMRTWEAV